MSRSPIRTPGVAELHDKSELHQMEMLVLTQVRDSLALQNANITKLNEKMDVVNTHVITLIGARYDEQIAEAKLEFERRQVEYRTETERRLGEYKALAQKALDDQEARIRLHESQLAKIGLGMAITAAIGASSLAYIISMTLSKIYGAN